MLERIRDLAGRWRRPRMPTTIIGDVTAARLKVIVFADAIGPTLQLNLLRPLRAMCDAGACSLVIVTEDGMEVLQRNPLGASGALQELWRNVGPCAVFASRYGGPYADVIVGMAKANHSPLIFHLDDNLFEVPPEIGAAKYRRYRTPARQSALWTLIEGASLVYLSTEPLRQRLAQLGLKNRVHVGDIASASDPLPPYPKSPGGSLVFGYMASGSHAADLELALPAIVDALERHPAATFEMFGSLPVPPALDRFHGRIRHRSPVRDYDGFLQSLQRLGWDFGIAPLRDTPFNAVKTDTKWVEYTAAGIPVLASDREVYRRCCADGAGLLVPDDGWSNAIQSMITDKELRAAVASKAVQRLKSTYSVSRLRLQLLTVLAQAGTAEANSLAHAWR